MCQMNKSELNPNMHPFGMLDRDQRTILTYSITKLNQNKTKSFPSISSPFNTAANILTPSTDKQIDAICCNCRRQSNQCDRTFSWVCGECHRNHQLCDKNLLSTSPNMHQSSCIMTNNCFNGNTTSSSHLFCQTNTRNHLHLINRHPNTQCCNKQQQQAQSQRQQQQQRHHHLSTNKNSIKMNHRTIKYFGKTSKFFLTMKSHTKFVTDSFRLIALFYFNFKLQNQVVAIEWQFSVLFSISIFFYDEILLQLFLFRWFNIYYTIDFNVK